MVVMMVVMMVVKMVVLMVESRAVVMVGMMVV